MQKDNKQFEILKKIIHNTEKDYLNEDSDILFSWLHLCVDRVEDHNKGKTEYIMKNIAVLTADSLRNLLRGEPNYSELDALKAIIEKIEQCVLTSKLK